MLESSFEDIIYLDRIGLATAQKIVERMLGSKQEEMQELILYKNIVLIWLFGSGIPREVKRNVAICVENNISLRKDDPYTIWKYLFTYQLDSLRSWALIVQKDERKSYNFLQCLDMTIQSTPASPLSYLEAKKWYKLFSDIWSEYYKVYFNSDGIIEEEIFYEISKDDKDDNGKNPLFDRSIVDITIGAFSVFILFYKEKIIMNNKYENSFLDILRLIPCNPLYSYYRFHKILEEIGLFTQAT